MKVERDAGPCWCAKYQLDYQSYLEDLADTVSGGPPTLSEQEKKMNYKFKCWDPGSTDEQGSVSIVAINVTTAAEQFAASRFWQEPFREIEVCVRDESGGLSMVDVEAENVPTFSGTVRIASFNARARCG